ncbi:MAG TPA: peptide deformylase, partial [Chitinophagales bacterium]|nr:peptide deformylase [Chitinophagales bacterium]
MILPIVAYGSPVLIKKAVTIPADYPGLSLLINDMFETMYNARGVGLAAPQVDLSIRLFIVDTAQLEHDEGDDDSDLPAENGIKQVFINPEMIDKTGKKYA